jgi:hypothetical protein
MLLFTRLISDKVAGDDDDAVARLDPGLSNSAHPGECRDPDGMAERLRHKL